ncbi:MAG: GNAT family N-acetyltransferase [Kiritimatiellae bacterium]|nr:GNAT family N-acetyltransferase [Kiritimatiellia bacterium]
MILTFTSPFEREPGIVAWLLKQSYAELVASDPKHWELELENWEQSDHSVFENPRTVGACTFLSWANTDLVGLFCFDPRPKPAYGVIGHNCILPQFRGQGFGKQQILEILRRFRETGIRQAKVSTNDHPFFVPARRMYTTCVFREVKRVPWDCDPKQNMIHYEMEIGPRQQKMNGNSTQKVRHEK